MLTNDEYVNEHLTFDDLLYKSQEYNVNICKSYEEKDSTEYPPKYFKIEGNKENDILEFLSSFIKPEKLDEVSVWILRDDQISLDDDCMILDKSTLP